jgi:SNF2 family DNA or RNA helicase
MYSTIITIGAIHLKILVHLTPNQDELVLNFEYHPTILARLKNGVYGRRYDSSTNTWRIPLASLEDLINEFGAMVEFVTPYKQIWLAIDRIGPILGAVDNKVLQVMKLKPYDYQLIGGTSFLPTVKSGILADVPGLGKTIQTFLGFASLHERGAVNRCLVFCKKSLKSQWLSELERFTPYKGIKIHGSPEKRKLLYEEAMDDKYNFIFINYEFLQHDKEYIKKLEAKDKSGFNDFEYLRALRNTCQIVALDEAQKIKNATSKVHKNMIKLIYGTPKRDPVTPPEYRWALTGTPIENSPEDLYNLCKFVNPQIFGSNPMWFKRRYFSGRYQDVVRTEMLGDLRLRIAPFMLRRTQEVVEQDFPEILPPEFLFLDMEEVQAELHKIVRSELKRVINEEETKLVLGTFAILLQIADNPELLSNTDSVLGKKLYREYEKEIKRSECPKIEWIMDYLTSREAFYSDRKAIIFTRSDDMAYMIQDRLKNLYESRNVLTYTGGMSDKQQDKIKSDFWNHGRALIATDAGSEGLNLQCADLLINVDLPFNPSRMAQRIGRIGRAGSKFSHVRIINLLSKGSIDERIRDIIYAKQDIIDKVIEGNVTDMKLTKTLLDQLLGDGDENV